MRIEIEELVNVLGKELAHSTDELQGRFLNNFAAELRMLGASRQETQLCYLSDKLSKYGCELIVALADFVKIREENKVHAI
jgi:hypothetical protein